MTGFAGTWATYGPWASGAVVVLLALFYLLRGRVRIAKGWAGFDLVRFGRYERLVHWLLALSFIALALSGLAAGQAASLLEAAVGHRDAASLAAFGHRAHRAAAIGFGAALLLSFLLWAGRSLPHWRDAVWLLMGGGLLVRGVHPAAWRFNAGQKLFFWLIVVLGSLASLTGLALLFPASEIVARAWSWAGGVGIVASAPATVDAAAEARAWHILAAWAMICLVLVHVYLRTVGIQGSFAAMASGRVDANWARQHHRLWAEPEIDRIMEEAEADAAGAPPGPTPEAIATPADPRV